MLTLRKKVKVQKCLQGNVQHISLDLREFYGVTLHQKGKIGKKMRRVMTELTLILLHKKYIFNVHVPAIIKS